jgi:hypothetical protein
MTIFAGLDVAGKSCQCSDRGIWGGVVVHSFACAGVGTLSRLSHRLSRSLVALALLGFAANAFLPNVSVADENGISFWIPGQFGSLAAVPAQPGWSFASVYYHASVNAEGAVAAGREVAIGRVPHTVNVNLNVNMDARADLQLLVPTYTFQTPMLGGQFALSMAGSIGYNSNVAIDGTLTTPFGTRQGSITDSRGGFSDLYPMATIKWHDGVNNFMTYVTGDVPVGTYEAARLANFGIGHAAIDGGVGYTYLDLQTGREFSVVSGLTYNFRNTDTDYQNGIDWHLDWALSQFISKQAHIGAVGYFYQQITDDSGAPAILGDTKSRVIGVGPQIGYLFPVGNAQGYLNLKGYYEVDAAYRPKGWNTWLTFSISPAPPQSATH